MFESACRMNSGVMFVLSAGSRALSQREPQSFSVDTPFASVDASVRPVFLFLPSSPVALFRFFFLFSLEFVPIAETNSGMHVNSVRVHA